MRNLYWKIFLSFWLATILIIITTALVTSELTKHSSILTREQVFIDKYANTAINFLESGQRDALKNWLKEIGQSRKMTLFLLCSTGEIIGNEPPTDEIKKLSSSLIEGHLNDGMLNFREITVSHEILSTSGTFYRLAAINEEPLTYFIMIPWASLALRLLIAIIISGIICYFLSIYLTQPLRSLGLAAQSIATGKLNTRVGHFKGHHRDEIAQLSHEFDRMAEQLETLIHSKERLLQDISHELRSPLARLHIAIELGRNKMNQNEASNEFARMETECLRLNTLIGEILAFARLDKSPDDLHKTDVNMVELLNNVIEDANFEANNLKAYVKIPHHFSCELSADERLIHRAIENIVRNALRYSPPHATVQIVLSQNDEKTILYIDILDEGPGVPEEQLQTIFNPFYRVDTSREKKTGGYGLGLSIAEKAVRLHGGIITATNRAEGGLQVRVTLPC